MPGVGRVTARFGFSPAPLDHDCQLQSSFPQDQKLTTPFFVYVVLARQRSHFASLKVAMRENLPDGRERLAEETNLVWPEGADRKCFWKEYLRLPQAGTYRLRWFVNGMEVGRLTVDVN